MIPITWTRCSSTGWMTTARNSAAAGMDHTLVVCLLSAECMSSSSPRFHASLLRFRSLRARPGLGDGLVRSRRQLRVVVLARVPPPVGKGQAVPADVRLLVGAGAAVVVRPDKIMREDELA